MMVSAHLQRWPVSTAQRVLLTLISTVIFPAAASATMINYIKLVPADGLMGDFFGGSVAVQDGTAVISAPGSDDQGSLSGSVYVYTRNGVLWLPIAKIIPDDGERTDVFGASVSIDGNTLVVGADGRDDLGVSSGAAYVYQRVGDAWVQQAKLLAADGAEFDSFGQSVAIDGDTIVVGAASHNGVAFDSGAAYVFVRSGADWIEQAKLAPADGNEYDEFGYSVAISGETIVVGSRAGDLDNIGSVDTNADGFAHIYVRVGNAWVHQAKLLPSSGTEDSRFGSTVALDGDTAIVGALFDSTSGERAGLAYVFVRASGAWQEQARLIPGDGSAGDHFGVSVDIDGDAAVVGASGSGPQDFFDRGAGAGYVFARDGVVWSEQARLVAGDRSAGELFGNAVAVSEGVAIFGSPQDSPRDFHSGSAYVARLGSLDAQTVTENVSVTKTVDNALPAGGTQFEFTVTATNNGQTPVGGFEIIDELPAEFEIPPGAGAFTSQGNYDPQTGVWTVGDLPAAGGAVLTIPVVISANAQVQCSVNFAALDGIADPNPADDIAAAAVVIDGGSHFGGPRCYDLRIAAEPQPASFRACEKPTFHVTVENAGPAPATGVTLTASPAATAGCSLVSGNRCIVDHLEPGEVRDIEAVMDVPQVSETINWRYTVTPDPSEWDIDATNDVVAGDQAVSACSVAMLSFSQSSYSVTEGYTAWITVERSGNTGNRVLVDYRTVDGTARDGSDYLGTSGQLIFHPGVTELLLTVDAIDDDNWGERSESASITLSNPFAETGQVAFESGGDSETAELVVNDGLNLGGLYNPGPLLDSGGGCFIATAAYGSYLDPHVVVLREFRDRYLLTNTPGRSFVAAYYEYSPPLADIIDGNDALRFFVRLLLTPLVYAAAFPGEAAAFLVIALMTGMSWQTRRKNSLSNVFQNSGTRHVAP